MRPITRQQYFAELSNYLTFLPDEEREKVIGHYKDLFDDCPQGEEPFLIQSLPTPMRIALALMRGEDLAELEAVVMGVQMGDIPEMEEDGFAPDEAESAPTAEAEPEDAAAPEPAAASVPVEEPVSVEESASEEEDITVEITEEPIAVAEPVPVEEPAPEEEDITVEITEEPVPVAEPVPEEDDITVEITEEPVADVEEDADDAEEAPAAVDVSEPAAPKGPIETRALVLYCIGAGLLGLVATALCLTVSLVFAGIALLCILVGVVFLDFAIWYIPVLGDTLILYGCMVILFALGAAILWAVVKADIRIIGGLIRRLKTYGQTRLPRMEAAQ